MSHTEGPSSGATPPWALQQAIDELYDVDDSDVIARRAQEIADEAQELEEQRHDEYDDPDEGGEA